MQSSHINDPNQSRDFLNVENVPLSNLLTKRNDVQKRNDAPDIVLLIEVAVSSNFKADSLDGKLFSLHIRSMWETISDAWACWSGWNSGPNSTEYPYSEIQNPPPQKWKLSESPSLRVSEFEI